VTDGGHPKWQTRYICFLYETLPPQAALTPFAKQSLNEMQPKYLIEVFQEQELQVNITKHVLVPKHQARAAAR